MLNYNHMSRQYSIQSYHEIKPQSVIVTKLMAVCWLYRRLHHPTEFFDADQEPITSFLNSCVLESLRKIIVVSPKLVATDCILLHEISYIGAIISVSHGGTGTAIKPYLA